MAIVGLKLIPTVDTETTASYNSTGINSSNLIRFKSGLPQKLGGWTKYFQYSLPGTPKELHAWQDLNAVKHLAAGTTQQLSIITSGVQNDITPQTLTSIFTPNFSTTVGSSTVVVIDPNISNVTVYDSVFFNTPVSIGGIVLTGAHQITVIGGATTYDIDARTLATALAANAGTVPSFTTASGSPIVTVTIVAHGLSVGAFFTFPIATTGNGVTILGTYPVLSVGSANTFTIAIDGVAVASSTFFMNGGNAELIYYINLGPAAAGIGFGVGAFGAGGFGSGVTPTSQTGTPITSTDWTIDNWGEALLSCPENGGVYQWSPSSGFSNAGLVATAPIFNTGIFVAMPEQILVCYGSTAAYPGAQGLSSTPEQRDPLIVRWSDSEDYTNFTVTSLTQAGSFHIPKGSVIRGGLQGPQQALIWTDIGVWAMSYLGPPFVFGFNEIGAGCGLVGKHAAAVLRGSVFWMSEGNFFVLAGGGVQVIPCSVWDVVFQDLDTANAYKARACPNSEFGEMGWEFPSLSGGTGENDTYVKFNVEEKSWDYGTLSRSAWIDQSILGSPIATTPQGVIYQHETSPDADGQPLLASFRTGWFVLSESEDFPFIDWIFPDMKFGYYGDNQDASVQMTIYVADYPNSTQRVFGPFTMTAAKNFINCRLRGRLISLQFQSSDLGTFWRLGLPRYRVAKDGRR